MKIRDGIWQRVKVSKRLGPTSLSDRAARKLVQPILNAVNNQVEVPVRNSCRSITLSEFIPEWRRLAAPSLKPSTLKGMESNIRAHIIPVLGDKPLTQLDTRQFQELLISIMEGRAKGTRKNVIGDLQTILKAARKWHNGIPVVKKADLYFGVKEPGEGKRAHFTVPQMKAILREIGVRKPWGLFFALLPLSGLRSNEILGLYVEDLDFENNLIWIRRGAWNGKIQTVKTRQSENSIPMTPLIKQILRSTHLVGHSHQLLFPNRLGRPYNRGRVVQKILHPILDKLGICRQGRRIGLHAFRHMLASMLLQTTGAAVAQRQRRHADAAITLGITVVFWGTTIQLRWTKSNLYFCCQVAVN